MIKEVKDFYEEETILYKWLLSRVLETGTIDNPITALILDDRKNILKRYVPQRVMDAYINCWSSKCLDDIYFRVIEAAKDRNTEIEHDSYKEGYEAGMSHAWDMIKEKFLNDEVK